MNRFIPTVYKGKRKLSLDPHYVRKKKGEKVIFYPFLPCIDFHGNIFKVFYYNNIIIFDL